MKTLNAVVFKDLSSFNKNKTKKNVKMIDYNSNTIVFSDETPVKPNKEKVSHTFRMHGTKMGIPTPTVILKSKLLQQGLHTCEKLGLKVIKSYEKTGRIIATLPEHMSFDLFYAKARITNAFIAIHQDYSIEIKPEMANFTYDQEWHLVALNCQQAWDVINQNPLNAPSQDNVVVVVDWGCQYDHPDLIGQTINNVDYFWDANITTPWGTALAGTSQSDVRPKSICDNHGTPCTGQIAAKNDGLYTTGVAGPKTKVSYYNAFTIQPNPARPATTPSGVPLNPCRGYFTNDPDYAVAVQTNPIQYGGIASLVASVEHAISIPNCVAMSFSLSGGFSSAFQSALNDAMTIGRGGKGIVICAAQGNGPCNGGNSPACAGIFNTQNYPAWYPGVLGISAIEFNNGNYRKTNWSDWGTETFAGAPGSSTPATDRTGGQGYSSDDTTLFGGTSSACPIFAGVIGAVAAANPDLNSAQIKNVIKETCTKIGLTLTPYSNVNTPYNYNENPLYPGKCFPVGYGMVNAGAAVTYAVSGVIDPGPGVVLDLRVTVGGNGSADANQIYILDYTLATNLILTQDEVIAVTVFYSTDNSYGPGDVTIATFNVTMPAGTYIYSDSYQFTVPALTAGQYFFGVNASSIPGETFTLNNSALLPVYVYGIVVPPNLNLKVLIEEVTLNADNTSVTVYYSLTNTGLQQITDFTVRKGFVGYSEAEYQVFKTLNTDEFVAQSDKWEQLPNFAFLYSTPFRIEITSVNGIPLDDVVGDNISLGLIFNDDTGL